MNRAFRTPDRQRGGLLVKLLLLLAVFFAVAAIAWVVLLPSLVVSAIHSRTGFALRLEQFSVNPFTGQARIAGLVLQNPTGWPEPAFVDLRRFEAEVAVTSLFSSRLEADRVVLDLAQVTVVRNQQGQINAMLFKDGLAGPAETGGGPAKPTAAKRGFLIHRLELRLDRLVYADYSGKKPAVKTFDLALRRDLTEVDSITKIISPLTGSALGLVTVLAGRLFPDRPDLIPGTAQLQDAAGALQEAGRKTGETLKSLIQSLEKKKP